MPVDPDKINRAIRECIRQCFGSNAVLAKVAAYLDALRQKPDWKASEVRLVEKGVRDVLKGVVTLRKAG